jgi:hypothetical protein
MYIQVLIIERLLASVQVSDTSFFTSTAKLNIPLFLQVHIFIFNLNLN